MLQFILRRLGLVIPTFIGITLLTFAFVHMIPGDPVMIMAGERGISPERHAQLLAEMGLDKPLWQQYAHYIWGVLHGDLGISLKSRIPVWQEFVPRFKATLELGVCAMIFAVAVGIGYKGPEIFIQNMITKRTHAIRKGLPDALDLLVICAEAGLTVDAAFNRVAKELGRAYPELGDEFALTAIELSFLTERRQAFENLAYRVDLEAVKGVTTTMVQTERYGTPLASALRVLSAEFRNERMMRAEEKAARLPAIMTVPLILFILPVLFIVILGPAACSLSDAMSGGSFG